MMPSFLPEDFTVKMDSVCYYKHHKTLQRLQRRPSFADTNLPRRIYILRKNYYSPESTLSSVLLLLVLPIQRQIVSLVWVNFSRICSSTRVQEFQSPFCIATQARLASFSIQYGGSVTKVHRGREERRVQGLDYPSPYSSHFKTYNSIKYPAQLFS